MVYESLITILETNIEPLAEMWAAEVKASGYMHKYKALSLDELEKRGNVLFTNLLKWLRTGAYNEEVEYYFDGVGRQRMAEGIPLAEIEHGLYLEKKVVWSFVVWKEEILYELAREEMIEVMSIINNYFDLGSFSIIHGYLDEMTNKLKTAGYLEKGEIKKIIHGVVSPKEKDKSAGLSVYSEPLGKKK